MSPAHALSLCATRLCCPQADVVVVLDADRLHSQLTKDLKVGRQISVGCLREVRVMKVKLRPPSAGAAPHRHQRALPPACCVANQPGPQGCRALMSASSGLSACFSSTSFAHRVGPHPHSPPTYLPSPA